jgi:hypothetical protein
VVQIRIIRWSKLRSVVTVRQIFFNSRDFAGETAGYQPGSGHEYFSFIPLIKIQISD